MTLHTIPLSKLVPSSANVRKTGGISIDDLAASIASSGLLNNLVVRSLLGEDGTPTGKYEVVAGGRRLAALKRLAKEKRVAKNMAVPCNILDAGNATEISLAENVIRQAMHPADQFEAYAALAGQGLCAEEIAARFGTTDAQVKKLLRLASVSPRLMAAYRDGAITLDHLMAFTVSGDHEAQERVWEDGLDRSPAAIRRALTEAWVDAADRLVRFVGIDAYVAAGGTVIRDLFQAEHEGYLTDRSLLERLVREKLETIGDELRSEGWQWVEVIPDFGYAATHGFRHLSPEERPFSEEDEAEHDALATEYDSLAEDEIGDDAVIDRLDAIETRLSEIADKYVFWPDEVKACAGAVLSISRTGTAEIDRGLMRPTEQPQASNDNGVLAKKTKPSLSSPVVRQLTAHRTAALRAVLADHPDVALDVVVYTLALPVFYAHSGLASCLTIRPEHTPLRKDAPGIEESLAGERTDRQRQAWMNSLPEAEGFWDWLREQPQERKCELLAFCAAQSLMAVRLKADIPKHAADIHADLVHTATGLDMAQWWQPTRRSYLGQVSRTRILEAVREACGLQTSSTLDREKRDAMIDRAERKLAGTGWLPALLRAPAAMECIPAEHDPLSEAA